MTQREYNDLPYGEDIRLELKNGCVVIAYKLKAGGFCSVKECKTVYNIEEVK
jgi:hypothetical protein